MSHGASRARKFGVVAIAAAVGASLSPLLVSPAGAAPPPAPSIAAVCANTDNVHPFTDLDAASGEALAAINCLVDLGIVNGTTATTFSPSGTLTRQQGAALIARVADAKNANDAPGGVNLTDVPATGTDQFTDDEGSTLEDSINRLAAVDIIQGKTATIFDPTAPLTRGQFASLIDRMETYLVTGSVGGASPWATATDFFTDDNGSVHEAAINRVASKGILRGDGNVTSGVNDPISRTQAALVIARLLAVNLADGLITAPQRPPASNQTFTIAPATDVTLDQGQSRSFTVAGLGTVTQVDIALVDCAEVTNTNGNVTFGDNEGNANEADDINTANAAADISTVNGVAQANNVDFINNAAVVNGQVTFAIQGDAPGCVVAVVFADADNDNQLDLNANDTPSEGFVVTGRTTFVNVTGVDANPETDTNPFATPHTVTAQLTGTGGNVAVAGRNVIFQVLRGTTTCNTVANTVTGGTVISTGTVPSGANGQAVLTYNGPADPSAGNDADAVDCIVAVLDMDNDGLIDVGEPTDVVTKIWSDEAGVATTLVLTPETDTNPVGTTHQVTALVTNQFGQPLAAGQNVVFDIYRAPGVTPISSTTVATNAQGQAILVYGGPATEADDAIVACIEGPDVDTICTAGSDTIFDTATKRWFSTPVANTNTPPNSCVRFADTTSNFVDVEAPAGGANNRLPYDGTDQFNVDGLASDLAGFEAAVTTGDRIQVNFVPGGVSVFSLTTDTDCTP